MIGVKKISHATYETPDLDQQIEYYTDILGLTLIAKEKDAAYLASTARSSFGGAAQGRPRRRCVRLGFQVGPDDDLGAFEKQTAAHGIKTAAQERPRALDRRDGDLRGPEGHRDGGVQARRLPAARNFRPRASCRTSSATSRSSSKTSRRSPTSICDVLGFRVSDWMGDFFSFLRCGADHHTINLMQDPENRHFHTAFELRDWGHMLTACDHLSLNGYKLLWGPGRHGIGHNLFTYHRAPNGLITELFAAARPDERGARLFRAAALASRPAAAAEGLGQGPERLELLGYHADRRNAQIGTRLHDKAARNDAPPTGRKRWRSLLGMRCARSPRRSIVGLLALSGASAQSGNPIKVGISLALTGAGAAPSKVINAALEHLARRRQRQGRAARPPGRAHHLRRPEHAGRTCPASTPS